MTKGELVNIRLTTGEYICGIFDVKTTEGINLIDALLYDIVPGKEQGQFGVRFTPLMPLTSPGSAVCLRDGAILAVTDTIHSEIEKRYRKVVSPLVVPEKDIKVSNLQLVK